MLSLWDVAEKPLSCLDEWDVFLDEVNRKVAGAMLVGFLRERSPRAYGVQLETAKENPDTQFIFITPLAMQGMTKTGVKVIRMRDPVRGGQ